MSWKDFLVNPRFPRTRGFTSLACKRHRRRWRQWERKIHKLCAGRHDLYWQVANNPMWGIKRLRYPLRTLPGMRFDLPPGFFKAADVEGAS